MVGITWFFLSLNNILLSGCTIVCLLTLLLKDILVDIDGLTVMNKAAENIHVQIFVGTEVNSLGQTPGNMSAGSDEKPLFSFVRTWRTVFQHGCTISFHQEWMSVPVAPPLEFRAVCVLGFSGNSRSLCLR